MKLKPNQKQCMLCLRIRLFHCFSIDSRKPDLHSDFCRLCEQRSDESKRDKRQVWDANKAARERNKEGTLTVAEWRAKKREYGFACARCGKEEGAVVLHIDHVVPLSAGGKNIIGNTQPLCGSCNSWKHTKTLRYKPLMFLQPCFWDIQILKRCRYCPFIKGKSGGTCPLG